jgi:hypothetical protein
MLGDRERGGDPAGVRLVDGGHPIDDMPDELRTPRRELGMLELAEREAVTDALRAAGG